jgi:hypothetical protein
VPRVSIQTAESCQVLVWPLSIWPNSARRLNLPHFYTVFVIDLVSRRVQVLGSTPHPGELFMRQVGRTLTGANDSKSHARRLLVCDRDTKWSGGPSAPG